MSAQGKRLLFPLPHLFFLFSVHPPQREKGRQEGACERADLSAVPLDTTDQGHHGGVFLGILFYYVLRKLKSFI